MGRQGTELAVQSHKKFTFYGFIPPSKIEIFCKFVHFLDKKNKMKTVNMYFRKL